MQADSASPQTPVAASGGGSKFKSAAAGFIIGLLLMSVITFVAIGTLDRAPPLRGIDKLMQDQLKSQVANTYGCSAPAKGTIKRGTTIFAKGVSGTILELRDGDKFTFDVDNSPATGIPGITGPSPYTVAGAKLQTTGMTSAEAQVVFVVCVNTQPATKIVKVCIAGKELSPTITGCKPE